VAKSAEQEESEPLVSHTGVVLSRHCAFRFALDPNRSQDTVLFQHAGTSRLAYNHHIGRVKANLGQREAEASYGIAGKEMTPSLSWAKNTFINEVNAWKTGKLPYSPVDAETGEVGLAWRDSVSADVFETASVDAAQALKNWKDSKNGDRAGRRVGFPAFRAKHRDMPRFRIRSKSKPGQTAPVRVTGPKTLRLGKLGVFRIHGCTSRVRKMIADGRFHIHSASFCYEKGRWWVSLEGVTAEFHHVRRSDRPVYGVKRHPEPSGMDRGVKTLAVVATAGAPEDPSQPPSEMDVLHVESGVRALAAVQARLRAANKALSRTKPGSRGHARAKRRLVKIHARISDLRQDCTHKLSYWCATRLREVTIETLNVEGMKQLRTLAQAVSDAAMGELGRQLGYKADWYGMTLTHADKWFASSKTCSGCGHIKQDLSLSNRVYRCDGLDGCGLVLDRDVNAAINLARWPLMHSPEAKARSAATTATLPPPEPPPPLAVAA
jgi:putative transposase